MENNSERLEEYKKKLAQNEARGKQLEQRVKDEERRRRNHFMIKAGAEVQSVLGRKLEEGDAERLRRFLDKQEMNGHFFTKAMNKDRVIREGDPVDTVCENPLT